MVPEGSMPRPSRRTILKSAAAGAIAAAAGAPLIMTSTTKAQTKRRIYGRDAHTYEVIDDWAKRPDSKPWGDTHMVQEVEDGRIFICHNGPDSVHVYDPDGKFITAWGGEMKGTAHGMDLRKEGNEEFLYFAPTGMHKVFKTSLKGEKVFELGYPKDAKNAKGEPCYVDEKKYVPTFIAFAPGGDFYVTDGYGSSYVHRYNIKGEYISTFGGKGNGQGQLDCPHGIYCDTRDPAKRGNHGVKPSELVPGQFVTPHGAIWDRAGNIYVTEWLPYGRVTKLRHVA